jgi:hypothetical protein
VQLLAIGFIARTRAALAVTTEEWRALRHLTSIRATSVTLRRPGRGRTRVTLDGEVTLQRGSLSYAVVPQALRILAANPALTGEAGKVMPDSRAVGI